jgi:hypothetical protein
MRSAKARSNESLERIPSRTAFDLPNGVKTAASMVNLSNARVLEQDFESEIYSDSLGGQAECLVAISLGSVAFASSPPSCPDGFQESERHTVLQAPHKDPGFDLRWR